MIKFIKYFSPFIIILSGIIFFIFHPYLIDAENQFKVGAFNFTALLFSIYWAVGFWIPIEINKTGASVGLGIVTLVIAGSIASLFVAILIPFILFGVLLIRKFSN
jgi:hypothetical protein